jgi:hypothetical protein
MADARKGWFAKALDDFARGVASGIADFRKEWEIFAYGRQVTGRTTNITIDSPGEQSPGEKLGWWRRDERAHQSPTHDHDRGEPAKDKALDRGIDL